MINPWLKKNPFMSMWLSAASTVAGKARGHATAVVRRQSGAALTQVNQAVTDFWMSAWDAKPKPSSRRKAKR
ncbi:hypothetical protein ACS5PN_16535 [Roseateles sp. NT4]|uniref:hypothetical protein n=1 Tax=Roseateles sp. NT4 TaxID=3453715 RepID=UPI003EEEF93C